MIQRHRIFVFFWHEKMLPVADKIMQGQAKRIFKITFWCRTLLLRSILQSYSRHVTDKVFYWPISVMSFWIKYFLESWRCLDGCVSCRFMKITISHFMTPIVTSRRGDPVLVGGSFISNQDRTLMLEAEKLPTRCIWSMCRFLSSVSQMVSLGSYLGKIDCKMGDLRRYRCDLFA